MNTINLENNLFSKKDLYMMECQRREFNQLPKRKRSAKVRMETFNNMHLAKDLQFTSTNGIPILQPYQGSVDFEVYSYSERKGLSGSNQAIHFFQYDCTFDNAAFLKFYISLIFGLILWSSFHSVLVRPFILVGVLRNYMAAGQKEIPTEADFEELDRKSPKFAKLHNRI